MQKTSQQTPENASSETRFDKIIQDSRRALLESKQKYPLPPAVDMEYFRATGIIRDKMPAQEQDATNGG